MIRSRNTRQPQNVMPPDGIASAQKLVILAFLAGLFGNTLGTFYELYLVNILTILLMLVAVYRLAKALEMSTGATVLFLIAMFIPFLGLVCLLILNGKATRALRKAGVTVGLFGAKESDLYSPDNSSA